MSAIVFPGSGITPIFLFGSARSGTTIAQTLIGSHPAVLTFPETNFIAHAFGDHFERMFDIKRSPWKRLRTTIRLATGRTTRTASKRMIETLNSLGEPHTRNPIPSGFVDIDTAITLWSHTLNTIALERGMSAWLEKTPCHIGYASEIQRRLPDARFLHIIRKPLPTVASLVDAGRRYACWSRYADVKYSLGLWNKYVSHSQTHANDPRHLMFRYESLISAPEAITSRVFAFSGLEPVPFPTLLARRTETAQRTILASESWKKNVQRPIANHDKTLEVLSADERDYVSRNAVPIPLEAI